MAGEPLKEPFGALETAHLFIPPPLRRHPSFLFPSSLRQNLQINLTHSPLSPNTHPSFSYTHSHLLLRRPRTPNYLLLRRPCTRPSLLLRPPFASSRRLKAFSGSKIFDANPPFEPSLSLKSSIYTTCEPYVHLHLQTSKVSFVSKSAVKVRSFVLAARRSSSSTLLVVVAWRRSSASLLSVTAWYSWLPSSCCGS